MQLTAELFLIFISHFQKSKTQKIVGCIQIFLSDMGTLWNGSLCSSQCLNLTSLEIHFLQLTTKNCSIWNFLGLLLLPKTCFGQRFMYTFALAKHLIAKTSMQTANSDLMAVRSRAQTIKYEIALLWFKLWFSQTLYLRDSPSASPVLL